MYPEILVKKFWSRVLQCLHSAHCQNCCWEWQGRCPGWGYGCFDLPPTEQQPKWTTINTHRFSWMLTHGPILHGLQVLHACDNPPCVNPSHLWLGTQRQNAHDMKTKGRHAHGETNGGAQLTRAQVYAIREYGRLGYPQQQIANAYQMSRADIGLIIAREIWAHLPKREELNFINLLGEKYDGTKRGNAIPWAKLQAADIPLIRQRAEEGIPIKEIAQYYAVSRSLISLVVANKIWRHVGGASDEPRTKGHCPYCGNKFTRSYGNYRRHINVCPYRSASIESH